MSKFYRIAGIGIRVSIADAWMYRDEEALAPFLDDGQTYDWDLEISMVDTLPPPEGELVYREPNKRIYRLEDQEIRYIGSVERSLSGAYIRTARRGMRIEAQALREQMRHCIPPKVVMESLAAEHMITQRGGFLLHASYIIWNGRAILFTAPSGTGKSTQADLWCRLRDAELINGERAVVTVSEDGLFAWGIPFSGSSGVGKNAVAPLAAIVSLSQAPATTISRLKGLRAFRQVWEGCCVNTWNREDMERCTRTVSDAITEVPVFHLACTPDESAVRALEFELEKRR